MGREIIRDMPAEKQGDQSAQNANQVRQNIETQMKSHLADERTQMVVLLHDVKSLVAYNLISYIDKIEQIARDMGYTPDFHPSDQETRMVLRSQSDRN